MNNKITLPWVDKIREFRKQGLDDSATLAFLVEYGIAEEDRITKEFNK